MAKPKAKPKKLPRRTITMADRADDGKLNRSTRKPSTPKTATTQPAKRRPVATARAHAHDAARDIQHVILDEHAETEEAEAIAYAQTLDALRAQAENMHKLRRAVGRGFDNAGLVAAGVIALAAFVIFAVAIMAQLGASEPVIVNVNPFNLPSPTAQPTPDASSVGDTRVPVGLHCTEDEVIAFDATQSSTPEGLPLGCVHTGD